MASNNENSVSILTPDHRKRRNSDDDVTQIPSVPCLRGLTRIVTACLVWSFTGFVYATDWQTNAEIAAVAEAFAKTRFGKTDGRVAPVAGHLDPRLKLPRCDKRLESFIRPGTKVSSRTIIGVRCSGSRPWKVYVPVNVVVMQPILVAKKTLPRGHMLTANDVVVEQRDISRLNGGYLSTLDELSGRRLKHQIIGGRVVTPSMLVADVIVKRGQTVTLVVQNSSMNISMAGKALSDGVLNQRIRVENTNSQRIVEGLIRSPEHVEILVH